MASQTKEALYHEASRYLVGGVTASTRLNKALKVPFFIARGDGSKVYDVEGREYVDLCTSHGATFLGHNNPGIKAAVTQALDMGIICSAETQFQTQLARKITDLVPSAELVRFATSGTEATMYAIRTARAYTGKEKIVKFEGHFHGIHDYAAWSFAPPANRPARKSSPPPTRRLRAFRRPSKTSSSPCPSTTWVRWKGRSKPARMRWLP